MRQDPERRDTLQAGCDTPTRFKVGDRVCGALDGLVGTVIAVGFGRIKIVWGDASHAVVYPEDSIMIRRALPWE